MKRENKILFIGPMGAGKTTAICSISDEAPVSTEARNSHTDVVNKATTTVALDYGRLLLPNGESVNLYGVPGQAHFDFVWPIIAKGALGAILLLDCSQAEWQGGMELFLDHFQELASTGSVVVALNRAHEQHFGECYSILVRRQQVLPVFMSDPRSRESMLLILEAIIANAEMEAYL
ncbi:MAG: GTP-binding protein [Oceanobacter sp.]